MERQVLPMDTHGKAKQIVSLATRKRGKDTDKKATYMAMNEMQLHFLLSYLCRTFVRLN